jgi:serine/threonine protein kinase/tetratricopeptide (TPR) repeat protein
MINKRYILEKKLGEGRSSVYLCSDTELNGKEFAIKILPSNIDLLEKKLFKDEFFSLKKLNHPLIVKPYDLGSIQVVDEEKEAQFLGSKYFTQEYFPGVELLNLNNIKNPYTLKEVVINICSVLYYLHQSNYIYYDLKPENILAAEIDDAPSIKLIDLGLASHLSSGLDFTIKGTAEYIAPEILREEPHDHRVDLYSLGILIYRIIYGRFPFNTESKIEIYKAHIEKEFEFPPADYPGNLLGIMKKLLNKDPKLRYQNSLQVIRELNSNIDNISPQLIPAKIFAGRKDIINIISAFIADKESSELYIVKGSEGSGKTSLVNEIYSLYDTVIPLFNKSGKTGFDFIKLLLKDIAFKGFVYPLLPDDLKGKIIDFLSGTNLEIIDEMKAIMSQITINSKFILIIDDFNSLDRFSLEVFKEIIPILQVNNTKVILTEGSKPDSSKFFHNTKELILNPFTEAQVKEFIEKSFADFFPRAELEKIILIYSDLLPGSIISFIRDLSLLKIIFYSEGVPQIKSDETPVVETILKSSHEEIYNIRLHTLNENEIQAAKYISAFETPIDPWTLSGLLNINLKEAAELLDNLLHKNIIQLNQQTGTSVITSEGFKKYIYSTVHNKKKFHSFIASALENVPEHTINRNEAARHYELAGNYSKSCSILLDEADNAERLSAFSYQKKIYIHLLGLSIDKLDKAEIKYSLSQLHYKLSEFENCLSLINELLQSGITYNKKNRLLILKGSCLVELGKYQEGKEILNSLIPKIKDKVQKLKLLTEIANAEFELGRYNDVKKICNKIIKDADLPYEDLGKSYNLLGLTEIFSSNNLDDALLHFEKAAEIFSRKEAEFKLPRLEFNIGNIFSNIEGGEDKAEYHWERALNLNKTIGNLETEGAININYGIYHFNNLNFEKALQSYRRGFSIFKTIGAKFYEGLINSNLGEIYLQTCEYQQAVEHLTRANDIFLELKKKANQLNSLFFLGKLYYIIGEYKELNNLLIDYNSRLNGNEIKEKQRNNFNFLYYLNESLNKSSEEIINNLKITRDVFFRLKDEINYSSSVIIISNLLASVNKYDEAVNELSDEKFTKICGRKSLFEAEREFMLGKISERKSFVYLKNSLEYFESAYQKIKDSQVTELTWKLLFSLGMYYLKRGNRNKAQDNFYYSKSVIFNIADLITDKRLKESYLKKAERKSALEIMLNELS